MRRTRTVHWGPALALALLCCGVARGQDTGAWLADLASEDGATRRAAFERATEFGPEVIPPLCKLFAGENPAAARAARLSLEAIVSAQSAPDAEDREETTQALLDFVGKRKASGDCLRYGLRLVSLIGGDDAVEPVAALLGDAELGEQARQTLCRIHGKAATEALVAALGGADATMKAATAEALGVRGDSAAVRPLVKLCADGTIAVRVAALGALGRLGDDDGAGPVTEAAQGRAGVEREAAVDALLRLAEARLKRDDRSGAADLYVVALKAAESDALRIAALVGIRKTGRAESLPAVLDAVSGTDRVLLQEFVACVKQLAGDRAGATMADAYDTAAPGAKGLLLLAIAKESGEAALPQLLDGLSNGAEEVRIAAATALVQLAPDPAAEPLLRAAEAGGDALRSVALTAYLNILHKRLSAGDHGDALGKQFAHALEIAPNDDTRRSALRGLVAFGDPGALALVEPLTLRDGTRREALAAYVVTGLKLRDTDRAKAEEILRTAIQRGAPRDVANAAVQGLKGMGIELDLAREAGCIVDWWICGALPRSGAFDGSAPIADPGEVDVTQSPSLDGVTRPWKQVHSDDIQGMYDLTAVCGNESDVQAFAVARVRSDSERDVLLKIGSDDGVVCWVNGDRVHANEAARPVETDQDTAPAHLVAGENMVLLKITQGGGGWGYCLRVTDTDGKAVPLEAAR